MRNRPILVTLFALLVVMMSLRFAGQSRAARQLDNLAAVQLPVGQDVTLTTMNYHEAWFADDPNNPLPWPNPRAAWSRVTRGMWPWRPSQARPARLMPW